MFNKTWIKFDWFRFLSIVNLMSVFIAAHDAGESKETRSSEALAATAIISRFTYVDGSMFRSLVKPEKQFM